MENDGFYDICPVPAVCEGCADTDCCVCDYFGERLQMSERYELRARRYACEQAIARYQRQIRKIDQRLSVLDCITGKVSVS